LIPLYLHEGQWHALFTRRTERVEAHSGQVSFPGGLIEPDDSSPEEAALREAFEEVGIQPGDVELIGRLYPTWTITRFVVTPIVGTIPWPYELRLNRAEVARAFGVPLGWLANPDNLDMRKFRLTWFGPSFDVHYFKPYDDEVIWGATGRIVASLLDELHQLEEKQDGASSHLAPS
jgi:8-oxo-dGTP pyrophosphatase MutT (NUDIX family)